MTGECRGRQRDEHRIARNVKPRNCAQSTMILCSTLFHVLTTSDCVLAATGGSPNELLVGIATLCIIVAVLLLAGARMSRRSSSLTVATGALALVGMLLAAPMITASPAQATQSQAMTVEADCGEAQPVVGAPTAPETDATPDGENEPVAPPVQTIVPVAPTVAEAACGVLPEVNIPDVAGVRYERTDEGDRVTVTAVAAPGFVFAADAQATWILTLVATDCVCEVTDDTLPEGYSETMSTLSGGAVELRLASVPSWWVEPGASSRFTMTEHSSKAVTWSIPGGQPLPEGVPTGPVTFDQFGSAEAVGIHSADGITVTYTPVMRGDSPEQQIAAALEDLHRQYPGISFDANQNLITRDIGVKVSISLPGERCTQQFTRETAFKSAAL